MFVGVNSGRKTEATAARGYRTGQSSAPSSRILSQMAFAVLGGLGARLGELWRMHRAYNELSSMTDLELGDIGIVRTDIPEVAAGSYFRERQSGLQERPSGLQDCEPVQAKMRGRLGRVGTNFDPSLR